MGHGGATSKHVANCLQQLVGCATLEEVAGCARGQSAEDFVGILVDGQHYDLNLWHNLFEPPDAFNAIHRDHINVHQHHIRLVSWKMFERHLSAAVHTDATKT